MYRFCLVLSILLTMLLSASALSGQDIASCQLPPKPKADVTNELKARLSGELKDYKLDRYRRELSLTLGLNEEKGECTLTIPLDSVVLVESTKPESAQEAYLLVCGIKLWKEIWLARNRENRIAPQVRIRWHTSGEESPLQMTFYFSRGVSEEVSQELHFLPPTLVESDN